MLHLHFANRQEDLLALLTAQLGRAGASLFTPDELIVPSAALRRQVTLALARQTGVAANLRFSYLAQWLWQQVSRVMATASPMTPPLPASVAESPWQPALLAWRVYGALAEPEWAAPHPRLTGYLAGADALSRWQLAQQVATGLDDALTYRPAWLAAWAEGGSALPPGDALAADEAWQAALWRRLQAELAGEAGPGTAAPPLLHALAAALARLGPTLPPGTGLPALAHVFCLPAMPPVHLALLQQLGRWMTIHVYALNPCQEYWFEVVDRRRLARLAALGRAELHEEGHRLLAAWGRAAQDQLAALVDAGGEAAVDDAHYAPAPDHTLLGRLQNSMLALADLPPRSVPLRADDRSIELHVCHSLTRELEVLHDRLLALLAGDDPPAPGDILVVTPDLDAAAPLIDTVFGTAPADRALPYTITGRAASQINAPAKALLALLGLAGSRCTVNEVFGLLQQPVVARRFGLDDNGLAQVHVWLQQAGVHWALDGAHRASFGLPALDRHSLSDGLARLFLGYALPSRVDEPFDGRLPAGNAEGHDAAALGALWQFAQALTTLHARTATPLPPAAWCALLGELLDGFLQVDTPELDSLAELRDALQTLANRWQRSALATPLPLAVVRQALQQALDEPARGGVPTGRITFSAMTPLRALPYRVVCMLGLDDGAFPGSTRAPEFDLIAQRPQRGDRQRRQDDRNTFLDLLLAARERLYLSHTGHSVRDNAPLPPSVLVAELLDYLVPALDADAPVARAHLVVAHPLQAFAESPFRADADPRQRSFQREYAMALAARPSAHAAPTVAVAATADAGDAAPAEDDTADADAGEDDDSATDLGPVPPFFTQALAAPGPEWRRVSLVQLQRFWRQPARFLLQQRLGLTLRRPDDALDDDEPFLPDWPARSALAARLLPALAAGADDAALLALAEAGTELPAGAFGARWIAQELPMLRAHARLLAALTAEPELPPQQATLDVVIDGQPWQLDLALAGLRRDGLLRQRYDEARAVDFLGTWLDHLALCAIAPAGVAGRSLWLGRDERFGFTPCDDAIEQLQTLLALYAQGLSEPLPYYPKTAWSLLGPGGTRSRAGATWLATAKRPFGEQADPAFVLALSGQPDPLGEGFARFEACAVGVLGPLLDHLDTNPALPG